MYLRIKDFIFARCTYSCIRRNWFYLDLILNLLRASAALLAKRVTADWRLLKHKLSATFPMRPADSSAHSRSTVTSAEAKCLHLLMQAEAAELSKCSSCKAGRENSYRLELAAVCSYVTIEYAGLPRSREVVLEETSF